MSTPKITGWLLAFMLVLGAAGPAPAVEQPQVSEFKFVGGTEKLPNACEGMIEVESTALTFKCPSGSVTMPFAAITLMQYRPDISRKVLKMKLRWQAKPSLFAPLVGGKKNRYFTIVYQDKGAPQAIVLEVAPLKMRPYLAEIDVKSGKRVEVKEYEEYD